MWSQQRKSQYLVIKDFVRVLQESITEQIQENLPDPLFLVKPSRICLHLLGQIFISEKQPGSHKSSAPPRVLKTLAGPTNQVFLTSSGPLLWHWTPLPWATGSWRASGRRGSFLCSPHHCQPEDRQNRTEQRINVGRLSPPLTSSEHKSAQLELPHLSGSCFHVLQLLKKKKKVWSNIWVIFGTSSCEQPHLPVALFQCQCCSLLFVILFSFFSKAQLINWSHLAVQCFYLCLCSQELRIDCAAGVVRKDITVST